MKKQIGLLIVTYNRPEYLEKCLQSLNNADLPPEVSVMIIDDASTDEKTVSLIKRSGFIYFRNLENIGIKKSLVLGMNNLISAGCELLINLDGDALVSNNFIDKLYELHLRFPAHIITGFNCRTLNADGSIRHSVMDNGNGFNIKKTVGGINMCLTRRMFYDWMLPALQEPIGNWDQRTCLNAGNGIICAVPSVIQHIGYVSSMGHTSGIEKPDTAEDFKLLQLPNVTLACIDCVDIPGALNAIDISCRDISFGKVKLLTSESVNGVLENVRNTEWVLIPKISSKKQYSHFVMKELASYIDTDYFIIIQADGFIINAAAWEKDFLNYDYIGAVWNFYSKGEYRMGNGGHSLRSKRLHDILKNDPAIEQLNDAFINEGQEDHNICRIYRQYLQDKHGIKFAPEDVANRYSIEAWGEQPPKNKYTGQFGFHGGAVDFNNADLPYVPYYHPSRKVIIK